MKKMLNDKLVDMSKEEIESLKTYQEKMKKEKADIVKKKNTNETKKASAKKKLKDLGLDEDADEDIIEEEIEEFIEDSSDNINYSDEDFLAESGLIGNKSLSVLDWKIQYFLLFFFLGILYVTGTLTWRLTVGLFFVQKQVILCITARSAGRSTGKK